MTLGIFGPPSHQPFGFYDPESLSVRTSQATLLSDSTPSSLTLPKWGCLSGGALYELPTPAHLTNAPGSSGLLRTPYAGTPNSHRGRPQGAAIRASQGHTVSLGDQIVDLLPTPAVNDMGAGKTPEAWDSWTADMQQKHQNGNGHGRSLSIEAQRLLPTPSASGDARNTNQTSDYASLAQTVNLLPTPTRQDAQQNALNATEAARNPHTMWAVMHRLTGEPTRLPSDGGNTPTGLPPGQLTLEDA